MKPDIEYIKDNFITGFYPATPEGEIVCCELAQNLGSFVGALYVHTVHAPRLISKLRRAGYSVRKMPKDKD